MSAHFLISAIEEAWRETIAQRLRIEELLQIVQQLERENAALRQQLEDVRRVRYSVEDALTRSQAEATACWEDRERLENVLASFYPEVSPVVENYPVQLWEHFEQGRCRGTWAEDGSPYYFTIPHQLVPAFFALQRLAKLCADKYAARAKEAKP